MQRDLAEKLGSALLTAKKNTSDHKNRKSNMPFLKGKTAILFGLSPIP